MQEITFKYPLFSLFLTDPIAQPGLERRSYKTGVRLELQASSFLGEPEVLSPNLSGIMRFFSIVSLNISSPFGFHGWRNGQVNWLWLVWSILINRIIKYFCCYVLC